MQQIVRSEVPVGLVGNTVDNAHPVATREAEQPGDRSPAWRASDGEEHVVVEDLEEAGVMIKFLRRHAVALHRLQVEKKEEFLEGRLIGLVRDSDAVTLRLSDFVRYGSLHHAAPQGVGIGRELKERNVTYCSAGPSDVMPP